MKFNKMPFKPNLQTPIGELHRLYYGYLQLPHSHSIYVWGFISIELVFVCGVGCEVGWGVGGGFGFPGCLNSAGTSIGGQAYTPPLLASKSLRVRCPRKLDWILVAATFISGSSRSGRSSTAACLPPFDSVPCFFSLTALRSCIPRKLA